MPPPYPPPRLRLARLLAGVPEDLGRQTLRKPMKNQHFRSWPLLGPLGRSWAALRPLLARSRPLSAEYERL